MGFRRVARDRLTGLLLASLLVTGCTTLKRCSYEGFGRDGSQKPDQVMKTLELEPGERVADLGAGSGYFTFRLAEAVGPTGKVYAVDVDEEMSEYLAGQVREKDAQNVEMVLATPEDPRLPEGGVDMIFTSNTYHHIENRPEYFRRARRFLAPDGKIAIIDYREDSGWFQRMFGHATPPEAIEREMTEAGYEVVARPGFLEEQTFLIFAPKKG